jgi:hypothetical protein
MKLEKNMSPEPHGPSINCSSISIKKLSFLKFHNSHAAMMKISIKKGS